MHFDEELFLCKTVRSKIIFWHLYLGRSNSLDEQIIAYDGIMH